LVDALGAVLERVECEPPLFHAEEVNCWPVELLEQWLGCGLLRPITPALTMPCEMCGGRHTERVVFLSGADGVHAYVPCRTCGPNRIDPDRLRRWELDLDALTTLVSTELACRGEAVELVPQRFWRLGLACFAGRHHNVFFGRMLTGHDGCELLQQQHISKYGVVFVPSMVPKMSLAEKGSRPFIFSLRETILSNSNALHLDKTFVESQVAGRNNVKPHMRNPSKRAVRTTMIADLTKAVIEHIRAARDHAHVMQRQTGSPRLLPRPTQRQLARQLGASQAGVNRCLADPSARELRYLWNLAVDLDRIMHNGH
jgi:hypothetical protein